MHEHKEVAVIPSAILLPQQTVTLMACPRPFSSKRIECAMPEGSTIAAMLRAIGLNPDPLFARVFIDDRLILKAEWEYATPKANQLVTVRVIPTGGGGGKDALRIVAMIGVVAAAVFTAGGALAGAAGLIGGGSAWAGATAAGFGVGGLGSTLAGVAVSIAGSLAVNALIPPAKPKLQDLSRLNLSPSLSLTGVSNQLAPYAPIARLYGRYRIFPSLGAKIYTETVGSDQYLRALFCCGYGPLALSEMKLGQTPIEQYEGVQLEVRYGHADDPPLTLIPDDVFEDALAIPMDSDVYYQRTSPLNVREMTLEFFLPNGLFRYIVDTKEYIPCNMRFAVDYRVVGEVSWTAYDPAFQGTAASAVITFPGSDNDIQLTASPVGVIGNTLWVGLFQDLNDTPGPLTAEYAVSSLGPDHSNSLFVRFPPGTTATEVVAAINGANPEKQDVRIVASLVPGNTGTGLVFEGQSYLYGGINSDAFDPLNFERNTSTPFRASITITPPVPGLQYEVRVKATRVASIGTILAVNDIDWVMLRTIQTSQPVSKPGLCLVAMRIKATGQLNGTLDNFNCIAESILPDWDGSTWIERPTSNPASIYRNILQGSANARALSDSRVDLVRLQAFHESCAAQGWSFNANVDYRTTVNELSRDVLAAGRASLHQQDGKFSVVEDLPQTLAKQLISPRNSWGFRGTRVFSDLPHALKVRFVNPEKDWQQDERIVYADGYSETNASKFEALELTGITDPEQAWKLARYHLAVATLRPETYEVNMDVEHLVCNRGDLVLVQHDVPLFGLITGRIKGVTTDSLGRASAITLDEPCVMHAGERYGVRIRLQDNTYVQREVLNVPGSHTTLTLLSPI